MESISRVLCGKNAADGLLILFWEARREKFLLEEIQPVVGRL